MYEQIYDYENLYKAHCLARRGKRDDSEVMEFELNLATEIYKLQYELKHQIYRLKPYKEFTIYDPKERQIHALHYRDRVVQHSLCDNIIAPYMERHLIYDNAASRKGKGTHFAMRRLNGFLQEFYKEHGNKGFLMKFDVRKYYDNIDHDILKGIYKNAFGYDRKLYALLEQIIDSYQVEEGIGIPLGNQTSQWFALSYLDGLDRLIKEQLHIKYYSRYMDDGVLIHESREYLRECKKQMEEYLKKERNMEFNEKTQIVPMAQGVDYLGFHFYLTENGKVIRRLRTSNKKRMKRKLKNFKRAYANGNITQEAVKRSLVSYSGHLSHGRTYHLRKRLLSNLVLRRKK